MNVHGPHVPAAFPRRCASPWGPAALLALALALAALALPGTALAAENSWRYRDGQPIYLDGAAGAGDVAALATEFSHWERAGDRWQTTYRGRWTTVEGATALGVDVSSWNGAIDWAAAKRDGVDFAILRCGTNLDDRSHDDREFPANVRGCLENHIPFGVYLYSYADSVEDAHSEADHVLRVLSENGLSPADLAYPVYYDLEEARFQDTRYNSLLASMADTFCTRMADAGYTPGVYSNQHWWETYLTDPVFDRWERWVANWNHAGEGARLQIGCPYGLWQCMATGWVDGIGDVDIDIDYKVRPSNNPPIPETDVVPGAVYRLYNRFQREHLLTADLNEAQSLWGQGWRYEGRAWIQPTEGGAPIYRVFNPYSGEHLYTMDDREYDWLGMIGWTREGVKLLSADDTGTPVYRLRNPYESGPSAHLYTADVGETVPLLGGGWEYEGICWRSLG